MSIQSNRTPKVIQVIAGVGMLAVMTCVVCAALFYFVWNLPTSQEVRSGSVSSPSVRISTDNISQVQKLYTISQRAKIKTLAWSPDSRLLAVGGSSIGKPGEAVDTSEPIKVWDVATSAEWRPLERPQPKSAFEPLEEAQQFEQVSNVIDATFSPDGQWLAVTYNYGVKVWKVADGKKWQTFNVWHTNMRQVAFSQAGDEVLAWVPAYYYSSDVTKTCTGIASWDVVSGRYVRCYTGYANFFVTARSKIIVWQNSQLFDLEANNVVGTYSQSPRALSHNGEFMASDSGTFGEMVRSLPVILTNVKTGKVIAQLDKGMDHNTLVAFSPDDKVLAVEQIREGKVISFLWHYVFVLWDPQTGKKSELDLGASTPTSIAFSPDGRLLAIGMDDGIVQVWGVKP